MLTMHEISELSLFQESLPEGREKELFNKLLFDYIQYAQCGTVEDCKNRKEWMSLSIDDMRKNFNTLVKEMREEVNNIRNEESVSKKRNGGKKNNG